MGSGIRMTPWFVPAHGPSILIRSINVSPATSWISAAEALDVLHVLPQTLYANVSRGKIRAKADASDPRRSLYHRDDVLRMARRANGRRTVDRVAAQAIEWGDPVLPSAISTVMAGRLWYRGHDVAELAQSHAFEDVARLLWEGGGEAVVVDDVDPETCGTALARGLVALARRSGLAAPTLGRSADALRAEAAGVHETLVRAMLGTRGGDARPLAARLASAWRRPEAEDHLRRALVLVADHELNPSTFAARVTVATGAALSAGALAGLSALSGPLHGGTLAAMRALMAAVRTQGADAALQGEPVGPLPGFGHPLYPQGDPRAAALLAALTLPASHAELVERVDTLRGERPNIDFALMTLADILDLPAEAPFVLFALGRSAGWLAHAIEQALDGRLIRPRARYVGRAPQASSE
jgi:citrate synthase